MCSVNNQMIQNEDNDNDAESGLAAASDEDLYSSQSQGTQKTDVSEEQNSVKETSTEAKDPNEIIKSDDLQIMVQNFKQIGGELEYNLKILESKRHSLNKILIETSRECEILNQQKEFQMKNLVDLQIRLENLDMERVKIWKENQKDKTEKTAAFTREMQSVLENDNFIRNTYDKYYDFLKTEKSNFEKFLVQSKTIIENHKKKGEKYIEDMREVIKNFRCTYGAIHKNDNELSEELDQGLLKCKSTIEAKEIIQEKIKSSETHLEDVTARANALKSSLEEKNKFLDVISVELKELNLLNIEKIDEINKKINEVKKNYDDVLIETKLKDNELSNHKLSMEAVSKEIRKLKEAISISENEMALKQQELLNLAEECHLLKAQLTDAIHNEKLLEDEAALFDSVKGKLELLNKQEKEIHDSFDILFEQVNILTVKHDSAKKDENVMTETYRGLLLTKEELEIKLSDALKEEIELSEKLNLYNQDAESSLKDLEMTLNELTCSIEKKKTVKSTLENEIKTIEMTLEDIAEKELKLNEEIVEVENSEAKINILKEELGLSNKEVVISEEKLVSLDKELETINTKISDFHELSELEHEHNKVELQIKEATMYYQDQISTIKSSFESQKKNWEHKIEREIKELDKRIARDECRTKRMQEALPVLNQDINILEEDLKRMLPTLAVEIRDGLELFDEIVDSYQKLHEDLKTKSAKTSIIRNLTSIEEQLLQPMKCMMYLEGMPKVNLDLPSYHNYKKVLTAFGDKFSTVFNQIENRPPLEMASKLQETGSCLYGKKWVKPAIPEIPNEAEISSSTMDFYY